MLTTRRGVTVSDRVRVFLTNIAERYNHKEGRARPGPATLMDDVGGWSKDTIRRVGREAARLGAITVTTHTGRTLTAEYRFTAAVWTVCNLDGLPEGPRERAKREKGSKTVPPFPEAETGKGGNWRRKKVAVGDGKGLHSSAIPTVSPTGLPTAIESAPSSSSEGLDDDGGKYVDAVLDLYCRLPDTRPRPTRSDTDFARELFRREVPFLHVRAGLMKATVQRHSRERETPLPPVNSLRYYADEIAAAAECDPGYLEYLAGKVEPSLKPAARSPR